NHDIAGVVLSGRVGFEMVQKAAMSGLHYIIALGAPSSLAIDLAKDCDICLIGFVKPTSCNLYSGEHLLNNQTTIARSVI
ncbi:MAG: formate dehydrogenase accessory sulfurtransferase FdhD, partial [Paraglaciecola sp.]|uniref:formate dehydrogenase accessory sulfurtransferase FdhD n=1 Tax=Paraglaciecola sp. TaxID=1920173 RepID=UPI0032973892